MSRLSTRRDFLSKLALGGSAFFLGLKPEDSVYDVYLILDDAGSTSGDDKRTQQLVDAGFPANIAVLPHTKNSDRILQLGEEGEVDILSHVPMEPIKEEDKKHMGKGGIYNNTSPREVSQILEENISSLETHVFGLNNHMGSLVTQNTALMKAVADYALEKDLTVIDSNTIPSSVMYDIMKNKGVRTGKRTAQFLDNTHSFFYTMEQLKKMGQKARQGSLIAIGHISNQSTVDALIKFIQPYKSDDYGNPIKDMGGYKIRFRRIRDFKGL